MGYQTNYIPNESPENSRQENLKIFKNRHIHKKIPYKSFCSKKFNGSSLKFNHILVTIFAFFKCVYSNESTDFADSNRF